MLSLILVLVPALYMQAGFFSFWDRRESNPDSAIQVLIRPKRIFFIEYREKLNIF